MTNTLTKKTAPISNELNHLITKLKDRQATFENAVRRSTRPALKQSFRELALERARFASQLLEEVTRLGTHPEETGTFTAALRRGLANFKSEMTGKNVRPEFEECHLQEFLASKDYRRLLDRHDVPPGLPSLLRTQLKRTEVALSFLRKLNRDGDNGKSNATEVWLG